MIPLRILPGLIFLAGSASLSLAADSSPAEVAQSPARVTAPVPWQIGSFQGTFRLYDGKGGSDLSLTPGPKKAEQGRQVMEYSAGDIQVALSITETGNGWYTLDVELKNAGEKEQWLEPIIDVAYGPGAFEWYDGKVVQKKAGERDELVGSLPLSTIYHGDRGIALVPLIW